LPFSLLPFTFWFVSILIFHSLSSEPVLCEGSPEIEILEDGWTVVTKDGKR